MERILLEDDQEDCGAIGCVDGETELILRFFADRLPGPSYGQGLPEGTGHAQPRSCLPVTGLFTHPPHCP